MKFGEIIKKQRQKLGIPQQNLAKQLRIDLGYLSKIERGKMPPPSDNLVRLLADILKLQREILFLYAYKEKVPDELREYFDMKIKPALLKRIKKTKLEKFSRLEKKAVIEAVDSFKEMYFEE